LLHIIDPIHASMISTIYSETIAENL